VPAVNEHRCRYVAHALPSIGAQLCRVHAGKRERRARPDLNQMTIEFAEQACAYASEIGLC
jgi:hypothetical protein